MMNSMEKRRLLIIKLSLILNGTTIVVLNGLFWFMTENMVWWVLQPLTYDFFMIMWIVLNVLLISDLFIKAIQLR